MFEKYFYPKMQCDLAMISRDRQPMGRDNLSALEILVLLLEDRRFFQHRGIDWKAVVRETFRMLTLQRYGGASTIDMQFVRTRTGYKARTLKRKLYEMLLARALQKRMSKLEILRTYLHEVYLGSRLYGISSAAEAIFQKPRYDLALREASIIAASMVYPRPRAPTPQWKKNVERRATYGLRLYAKHGSKYKRELEPDER
jgi:membrane peptidoglycan carboxypeptidase